MITLILLILFLLWLTGYIQLPLISATLFNIFGRAITLNDLLVFLVILWLIDLLPRPFQDIAIVLFLLWILSIVGIISIAGFSDLIILGFIVGLLVYLFQNRPIL